MCKNPEISVYMSSEIWWMSLTQHLYSSALSLTVTFTNKHSQIYALGVRWNINAPLWNTHAYFVCSSRGLLELQALRDLQVLQDHQGPRACLWVPKGVQHLQTFSLSWLCMYLQLYMIILFCFAFCLCLKGPPGMEGLDGKDGKPGLRVRKTFLHY